MKKFIRGLGTGILLTTLVFAIAYGINGNHISEEKVIEEAKKLGMVKKNDDIFQGQQASSGAVTVATKAPKASTATKEPTASKAPAASENPKTADAVNTNKPSQTQNANSNSYLLSVTSGDDTLTVCRRLQQAGMITDAIGLDKYMREHDYQKRVQIGDFEITKDMSFEQIAKTITKEH